MATYHFCVHPNVSRGRGQSLVRTAAYNARARLTDERTGRVWDYRHFGAVLFEGIYAAKAPDWARELVQLVNGIERAEKRADAQLAMNIDIALPHEQTLEQNRRLLQDFVREQFMRAGYATHVAIHAPEPGGDLRNIHAHVLVTLRRIGPDGFAPTKAEQQERYRNRSAFVEQLRTKWEQLANRHLARNGIDARIDCRSLDAQGEKRQPQQHRGPAVTAMQRRRQIDALGPPSCGHQASRAAQEPPAEPEATAAAASAPAQATEPLCAPAAPDSVAVLPPPATLPAQPEISPFGREYSHVIEDPPIDVPVAIEDRHADRNTAGAISSSIKSMFHAAVKAVLRREEPAPQPPPRRRKGETEGEFRRLARRCSRRTDMRQEFRQRASITSRFLSIPADVFAMATAHLADTLNSLTDDIGADADENLDANTRYISPQP